MSSGLLRHWRRAKLFTLAEWSSPTCSQIPREEICHPLGDQNVLTLAANTPRRYAKQDETWVEGIAEKLNYALATTASAKTTTGSGLTQESQSPSPLSNR